MKPDGKRSRFLRTARFNAVEHGKINGNHFENYIYYQNSGRPEIGVTS
jgi:hypothetical protein